MKNTGKLSQKQKKELKKKLRGVMSPELIEKYLAYANSPEAYAVLSSRNICGKQRTAGLTFLDLMKICFFPLQNWNSAA